MVNSKKLRANSSSLKYPHHPAGQPSVHPLEKTLRDFLHVQLQRLSSPPHLLLALSGGLDSMVLLHLLAACRNQLSFELSAMHIHHGLSVNADKWAAFCQQQCARLGVPLQVTHVNVTQHPAYKNSARGVEGEARELRYQALFSARQIDYVVTAHHQDDQAETLLLQLCRGAGVKGLASMAMVDKVRRLLRPFLGQSRQTLLAYAEAHAIEWCDDESNDNTQYDRNFLRHKVMPLLESRFKGVKPVFARAASHMAEANELHHALAEIDAANVIEDNRLCLQKLREFSIARIKNILRWWFAKNGVLMPTSEHLHQVVHQLLHARKDSDLNIKLAHLSLRQYQQYAYLCQPALAEPFDLIWKGEAELILPSGDKLLFEQKTGAGLALSHGLNILRITNRSGGERFKPDTHRPTRTLKYLFQAMQIPPWQRLQIPLVYWQDQLAFVPGVGVVCHLKAQPGQPGLEISWIQR